MGFFSPTVPGQYDAEHKSLLLKWLTPGQYLEVTGNGTFNLQPFEGTSNRELSGCCAMLLAARGFGWNASIARLRHGAATSIRAR